MFNHKLILSTLLASIMTIQTVHAQLPQDSHRAGGIAVIELQPNVTQVSINQLPVAILKDNNKRYAVVGIPLSSPLGELKVQISTADNQYSEQSIQINDYPYAQQRLVVKEDKYVNPDQEQLDRYKREADEQNAVYRSFTSGSESFPHFIAPTRGKFSNSFGKKRFFNGEPRAPHSGLDIPAPQGQKVIAPADGVIAATGEYFFNGNTVMIDHGHGIVSMICHLSAINVKKGDVVKQGDLVGLVGKTGRVTGPHLHWSLSLNDARVDPQLVLKK